MSKILNKHTSGTVGSIVTNTSSVIPTGTLPCDGAAVSRTTYPSLFAIIGITAGQGDGSTTFNVPDYRGRFLRGVSGAASNDPDKATRTVMNTGGNTGNNVNSLQTDVMQGHWHTLTGENGNTAATGNTNIMRAASAPAQTSNAWVNAPISDGANGTPRISSETRPSNAYVEFVICYK